MCGSHLEHAYHLSMNCPFAYRFWCCLVELLDGHFLSHNTTDLLSLALVGHPFLGSKRILWLAITREFFLESLLVRSSIKGE